MLEIAEDLRTAKLLVLMVSMSAGRRGVQRVGIVRAIKRSILPTT